MSFLGLRMPKLSCTARNCMILLKSRVLNISKKTALLTKNENLKAKIHEILKCITMDSVKPRVLAPGVNSCTDASGSQPRSNTKKNRISPAKSVNKKQVEEHPRTNKSSLKTTNHVDFSISSKRKVLTRVGYQWRPTGRIFTLGEQCPLTRLTKPEVVPAKQTENVSTSKSVITKKLSHTSQKPLTRYQRRNQQYQVVHVSLPTLPENQAIAASMQSAIAYANQQEPNQN
ncbi:hypothetical protein Tco_0548603 [Tanacetum coccineum]